MSDTVSDPLQAAQRTGQTLVRTKGGGKVHVPACSHLSWTSELVEITDAAEAASLELCSACESELSGRGRTTYPDLERAMEALPVPLPNRPMVRQLLEDHNAPLIWIPYSRSYIGTGGQNIKTRYVGKGYVWIDGETFWLPVSSEYRGGGSGGRSEREPAVCPTCKFVLPATGICDDCS